jgi:hypothetical protein
MSINRSPDVAGKTFDKEKPSETENALRRAVRPEKKEGPGPHPTLDGIKRREGAPEPASKT